MVLFDIVLVKLLLQYYIATIVGIEKCCWNKTIVSIFKMKNIKLYN